MNLIRNMSSGVKILNRIKTKPLCFIQSLQTSSALNSPDAPSFSSHRHSDSDMKLLETRLGFGKVI